MNILKIIEKKRDKKELSQEEIEYFVNEYTKGNITDYQAAALVMAIYINGMNDEEITNLTFAMAHSGEVLDLTIFGKNVVDKHSTGGVGDKITLILMPIIASLGIPVAKMSGRGLGFTGGTIDKLESIPNFSTTIDNTTFINNVKEIGISLISQNLNLAPADKKLYALRDTISCVDNIPLIASSIMSKKIAAGANKIVLEVTCGSGAFMENKESAIELAKKMSAIGKLAKREVVSVITNMEEPLGEAVGNSIEVIEAIKALKGDMTEDVKEVVLELGARMIKMAGVGNDIEENKKKILENIMNKKAYNKFLQLVEKQGGDISYIEDVSKFEKAQIVVEVISEEAGYVEKINTKRIGEISANLGAGRIKKDDEIDKTVGIIVKKKIADEVKKGDILCYVYANNEEKANFACSELKKAYKISTKKVVKPATVLEVIE